MKKLWSLLRSHFLADFTWGYYLSVLAFLAVGITFNYFYDIDTWINRYDRTIYRAVYYFILYATAYYAGLFIMVGFRKQGHVLRNPNTWILTLLGLVIFSIDSGFPYLQQILEKMEIDNQIFTWTYAIFVNGKSLLLVTLPLFLVYWLLPVTRESRLGLITRGFDTRPFFILVLMMLPIIVAASFTPEFINFYPTYKPNSVAELLHLPRWLPVTAYELLYAFDFFNVELVFRGFLVIGLAKVLGKDAIIPMVTLYCVIHFGKPLGEIISSIVGGYILGVIAFYTRGIWGGVIAHIGIAWTMEIVAYFQKYYLGGW